MLMPDYRKIMKFSYIKCIFLTNRMNHDLKRSIKLLLRRKQLQKLVGQVKKGGYTLVPISIYFNEKGFVKL